MKTKVRVKESKSVRRSVVLPRQLLTEAAGAAPKELHDNFNRLVRVALEEYIAGREREAFKQSMERMARDPALQRESRAIVQDFLDAEGDGLAS